jgi:hypothetical protein
MSFTASASWQIHLHLLLMVSHLQVLLLPLLRLT